MTKHYHYIALFLLGIFVFPIFSQPAHILWGHPHQDVKCDSYIVTRISLTQEQAIVLEKNTYCPICEYKPTTNNLPSIPTIKVILPDSEGDYHVVEVEQLFQNTGSEKSPRAPPILLVV